jgi:hypothetical protein
MKIHDTPESSNIARLMYDGQNLDIEFRKGRKYRYENVPDYVYEEFTKAPSAGNFFRLNIQGKYQSTEL